MDLGQRKVLIVDPSGMARATASRVMVSLGARHGQILLASQFEDAILQVREHWPQIILCDQKIGKHSGLEVLRAARALPGGNEQLIFILMSVDQSLTSMAFAAEELVDAFITKPFTHDSLLRLVKDVLGHREYEADVLRRTPPPRAHAGTPPIEGTDYLVRDGSAAPNAARFEIKATEPLIRFSDPKLSDAVELLTRSQESKQLEWINRSRKQYRLMVALYESHLSQQRWDEAYELGQKISPFFSAHPKRLMEMLRLCIRLQKFDQIDGHYSRFVSMEERNEEIIKMMCAALVTSGKSFLRRGQVERALDQFQKAAVSCAGREGILGQIVQALIDLRMPQEAEQFLRRFPKGSHESEAYLMLDFQIGDLLGDSVGVLARGRELIIRGHGDAKFFETMIKRAREEGYVRAAKDWEDIAVLKFPDFRI